MNDCLYFFQLTLGPCAGCRDRAGRGEKVIGIRDPVQFLWITRAGDRGFHCLARSIGIASAADEQLGLRTIVEKFVAVAAAFRGDRQPEGNQPRHARITAADAQADPRAKRKPREENGAMEFAVEPVERRAHVILFAAAFVMRAFAQSGAAKIETQHREAKTLEGFHRVIHNLVVQCAAAEGVWMTHQSGKGRIGSACIEQRLETTG